MHLLAAEGWLELGNPGEARLELDGISQKGRVHPEVLQLRWEICAKLKQWGECVDIGETLTRVDPERVVSWIHHAFALHELKRTQEAWDVLLPAQKRFPKEPTILYNLACYACQLGRLEDARELLEACLALGNRKEWKKQALEDPDLAPLWHAQR